MNCTICGDEMDDFAPCSCGLEPKKPKKQGLFGGMTAMAARRYSKHVIPEVKRLAERAGVSEDAAKRWLAEGSLSPRYRSSEEKLVVAARELGVKRPESRAQRVMDECLRDETISFDDFLKARATSSSSSR